MYYSDQVVEDVRSANNILDVVSSRVQLTKKGKYYFGLCPFHNEKTPSFSVDPDRQYYYCYSCNKGGDAYKFIMDTEKLSFPEAVQKLADRANIILPASADPVYNQHLARAKERQERYFDMYGQAARYYAQILMSDMAKNARAYMQKRMIRADMVRRFALGYALPDWGALYNFLRAKNFSDEELLSGGLIIKGKNGAYYDRFRNRIIFPIQDAAGRILAFGGRALDDETPKYLNSPESPFYNKGKNLYGLNFAKNTKEKCMIIVEGYMDLITLSAHGIDNAVAPLGTALTDMQARLLKRYSDDVVIAFDADAAGQAAAIRGLDILEQHGFRVRVLTVPESKDPDEFVKARGAPAFRELVLSAAPLLEYKIESLRKKYPEGEVENDIKFFKETVRVLAGVGDEVEREIYIGRIASRYRISRTSIKLEIDKTISINSEANTAARRNDNRSLAKNYFAGGDIGLAGGGDRGGKRGGDSAAGQAGGGAKSAAGDGVISAAAGIAGASGALGTSVNGAISAAVSAASGRSGKAEVFDADEFFIVALLSIDNSLWDIIAEKLPPEFMANQNAGQALTYACSKVSQGHPVYPGDLIRFLSSEESDRFAALLMNGCHCEDNRRAMEQKIKDILAARVKRQMLGVSRELEAQDLSDTDRARLTEQLSEYMRSAGSAARGNAGR